MKELYLKFLEISPEKRKPDNKMCCTFGHQSNPIKEVGIPSNPVLQKIQCNKVSTSNAMQEPEDMDIKDEILPEGRRRSFSITKNGVVRRNNYVYGSGSTSKKVEVLPTYNLTYQVDEEFFSHIFVMLQQLKP